MKNILIIGSTGQIGSELTMKLRGIYTGNVVAGYIPGAEPKGELAESGPSEIVDITNAQQIGAVVDKYNIDTIYNLAALLSAVAENKPQLAWHIGIDGLYLRAETIYLSLIGLQNSCLGYVCLICKDNHFRPKDFHATTFFPIFCHRSPHIHNPNNRALSLTPRR